MNNKNAPSIKLGSLFDGAGTFPFAALINGVVPVWASEIEPFPISVTSKRIPGMRHLGDVTKIDGSKIEPVDILVFGSPCQDLSTAGKGVGLKGERSGLFMEAVRIIKEMRRATNGEYPKVYCWENVCGALASNDGEDFRVVLEELCRISDEKADVPRPPSDGGETNEPVWRRAGFILGNSYSIAWRVFNAQYWGVPQARRRVYLVGCPSSQSAGEILFESDGLCRNFAEISKAWKGSASNVAKCFRATSERYEEAER